MNKDLVTNIVKHNVQLGLFKESTDKFLSGLDLEIDSDKFIINITATFYTKDKNGDRVMVDLNKQLDLKGLLVTRVAEEIKNHKPIHEEFPDASPS